MLLSERKRDPEEILTNLGFVGSEDAEGNDLQRLPERFLEQQSSAQGIDVNTIDLNRLLSLTEHEEMLEQINTSKMNADFAGQGKFYCHSSLSFLEFLPRHFINVERFQQLGVQVTTEDILWIEQEFSLVHAESEGGGQVLPSLRQNETQKLQDPDMEVDQNSNKCEMFVVNVHVEETKVEKSGSLRSLSSCSTVTSNCSNIYNVELAPNESLV